MKRSLKINRHKNKVLFLVPVILILLFSCEYDKIVPIQPPKPKTAVQTSSLEAEFVSQAPISVNDAHWNTAKYTVVEVKNIAKEQLYGDGKLNMTGTYNGLNSFNNGDSPEVIIRAAYDSSKLSIMVEWMDSDIDASFESLLFDGDADPRKTDSTSGWTSQRNSDNVMLAFTNSEKNGAIQQDVWHWSLALSEPLGYAIDKYKQNDEIMLDDGKPSFTRNAVETDNPRSAPMYEWNGEVQNIIKPDGTELFLDPSFFIVDDYKTDFIGNPEAGKNTYNSEKAKCMDCHGEFGEGAAFGAINGPGILNSFSRSVMDDFLRSEEHTGNTYYKELHADQLDDLFARLYGMAGVPGYILSQPEGSSSDLTTSSNVILAKIKKSNSTSYKVLIVRELNTGNSDDIKFDPFSDKSYLFDIYLSDNDEINKIGSVNDTLNFIKPEIDD